MNVSLPSFPYVLNTKKGVERNVKYSNGNDKGKSLTINVAIRNALIIRESVTTNL